MLTAAVQTFESVVNSNTGMRITLQYLLLIRLATLSSRPTKSLHGTINLLNYKSRNFTKEVTFLSDLTTSIRMYLNSWNVLTPSIKVFLQKLMIRNVSSYYGTRVHKRPTPPTVLSHMNLVLTLTHKHIAPCLCKLCCQRSWGLSKTSALCHHLYTGSVQN